MVWRLGYFVGEILFKNSRNRTRNTVGYLGPCLDIPMVLDATQKFM